MPSVVERELSARMRGQYSLIGRKELRALGVDSRSEARRVAAGELIRMGRNVLRSSSSTPSGLQTLMAACIEAGPAAVASHRSAAWLWGIADEPSRHSVTVARAVNARVSWATVHRLVDVPSAVRRHGIACTSPLRTIVDLAAVVSGPEIDRSLDRALASRLVSVEGVVAEMERLSRPGRDGTGRLRAALDRRGLVAAPYPSVLESRVLRLLAVAGIVPIGAEIWTASDHRYRIDIMLAPRKLMEVDGFTHHHSPEQKTEDERRRNRLRLAGNFILVYTWYDVVYDGRRVVEEVTELLRQ